MNKDWYNDKPTEKQVDLFKTLKEEIGYSGKKPKTKGEYRDAISTLITKQKETSIVETATTYKSNSWMSAYNDDYLGDQGIFPGY